MKSRGIEPPIGRPRLSFFSALKVFLLTALVVFSLNATFSLYTNVSKRYYTNPHPPFLRVSSSSTFSSFSSYSSYSSSVSFSSIPSSSPSSSSTSSCPYSNSHPPLLPPPSTPSSWESSMESESISSFPLESPIPPTVDPPSSTIAGSVPSSSWSSTPFPQPLAFNETHPPPFSSASSSYSSSAQSTTPLGIDQPPSSISPHPPSFLISSSEPIPSVLIPSLSHPKLEKSSSSYYNMSLSSSSSSSPSSSSFPQNNSSLDQVRGKRKGLLKGCDLSKGEWVPDPNAPYYTNSTCWAIQEHQNCLKYGRPNLDYLKWRWKPDGCELPLLDPAEFLELMRGKNLAFIGDSLARNQIQSLMCLLSRVEYPQEIWPSSADNVTQMFYQNYNFTIWTFWSPFLINAKEVIASNNYGMWSLYLDEPDPLWQPHLSKFDHIILNTGNWYNRPAHFYEKQKLIGCHYCVVKKVPFMSVYKAHRKAFRTALNAIVENKQGFKGVTVVRTVSPSHFEGGEWNKGGDCKKTTPLGRGRAKLKGMDLELYKDQLKEFWKAKWEGNDKGLEFRLLDTTQAMLLRPDGHPSRYGHWPHEKRVLYNDCVHWCLPGPVDMWNDLLFQVLII